MLATYRTLELYEKGLISGCMFITKYKYMHLPTGINTFSHYNFIFLVSILESMLTTEDLLLFVCVFSTFLLPQMNEARFLLCEFRILSLLVHFRPEAFDNMMLF